MMSSESDVCDWSLVTFSLIHTPTHVCKSKYNFYPLNVTEAYTAQTQQTGVKAHLQPSERESTPNKKTQSSGIGTYYKQWTIHLTGTFKYVFLCLYHQICFAVIWHQCSFWRPIHAVSISDLRPTFSASHVTLVSIKPWTGICWKDNKTVHNSVTYPLKYLPFVTAACSKIESN
jgi:hypothetical protein